jgi:hypothetical protein
MVLNTVPIAASGNIHTLIDLYSYTGSGRYLEPIPDALRWLESTRLQNGK